MKLSGNHQSCLLKIFPQVPLIVFCGALRTDNDPPKAKMETLHLALWPHENPIKLTILGGFQPSTPYTHQDSLGVNLDSSIRIGQDLRKLQTPTFGAKQIKGSFCLVDYGRPWALPTELENT